jgi:hypothetical protein
VKEAGRMKFPARLFFSAIAELNYYSSMYAHAAISRSQQSEMACVYLSEIKV